MLDDKPPICLIASTDISRSKAFYEEVLLLKCLSENEFGLVFGLKDSVLRIQHVPDFKPQGHSVLGWRVDDIKAEISELSGRDVEFVRFPCFEQDEHGIWETPGAKIAWFMDPDQNILSLTEIRNTA